MKPSRSILLLGPSGLLIVEGGPGVTMADQLCEALAACHPEVEWRCSAGLVYISPAMVRRAVNFAQSARPDAIVLLLGAPAFADDFVVNAIRRRWPWAYKPSLRLCNLVKSAAGGGGDGADGIRGLLFRLPRELAVRLIGAEPDIDLDTAVHCATETIDALLRFEESPLVCRLTFPVPFFRADRAKYDSRLEAFNSAVRAHCQGRSVPVYSLQAEMARVGTRPTLISDGVHPDRRTQTFDMGLAAERVAAVLQRP